jgi:anti-sigma28 factor (negative regulator of flagellin synthesis)
VHRTLHAFGHDILHSVLHFDGKIWRTLPLLFWKPGDLTRRYVHGERAKFVSPLALFLFSVFLTFAVFNWLAPSGAELNGVVSAENAKAEYQKDRAEIVESISALEREKADAAKSGEPSKRFDDALVKYKNILAKLDASTGEEVRISDMAERKLTKARADNDAKVERLRTQIEQSRAAGKSTAVLDKALDDALVESRMMVRAGTVMGSTDSDNFSTGQFTDLAFPGATALNNAVKHARENPQLLLYKIQSNAYKFSWALIPISVPFVWLLFFWRRRFKMFDHAVFVTYSITFMMLLGIISALFINSATLEPVGGMLLAFYPPIHMYRHIRHAYETSRFGAFWRMCLLSVFAATALTLFAVLVVALGVS